MMSLQAQPTINQQKHKVERSSVLLKKHNYVLE